MNIFQTFYDKANKTHCENKINQMKKNEEINDYLKEKEDIINENRINNIMNADPEKDCYSKELLELIKKFNFNIESYEKVENVNYDDYCPTLETYYCSFNNWNFTIRNFSDVDIPEGIFSVRDIKNKLSEEVVDFYADIGCRNTSKPRLDSFLEFLTYNSLEDYVENVYKKYLVLPELLREKGYNVEAIDYSFKLNDPKGYLKLGDNLYIVLYRSWFDDIKLVVTSYKKWDVNSSNNSISRNPSEKAYYFEYNSINDIEELCLCIDAFKEEQSGHIGFCENGRYYNNNDVLMFFHNLKSSTKYHDAFNHYLIRLEHNDYWDKRGYDEDNSLIVNKYKGLEIYVQTELTFNDASQWSIGNIIHKSIITFEYDKRKNDKQCRLKIDNYIYNSDEEFGEYDENGEWILNKDKLEDSVEIYGTFTEVFESLKSYVNIMCEIFELDKYTE